MLTIRFENGYSVMQDVHARAEARGITNKGFNAIPFAIAHNLSDFEPIRHLGHLQPLMEAQPNYGRRLRQYNNAPWWYKLCFRVPDNAPARAVLRVGGADYYADVYLNGVKLGAHEGYFDAFEFPADGALDRQGVNTLLIRVSSPWDDEVTRGDTGVRCTEIVRNMIKGTYEHADTFGCRDVNPVGLLHPVELDFFNRTRIRALEARARLEDGAGIISVHARLDGEQAPVTYRVFRSLTNELIYEAQAGERIEIAIKDALPWTIWERGRAETYRVEACLTGVDEQCAAKVVGFRTLALERNGETTRFVLNGEPVFVRGVSYMPDFYISRVNGARVARDLKLMKLAGVNCVRAHVHVCVPEFYELCDEMGLMVIQDGDLNWTFPTDEAFEARALDMYERMFRLLGAHPCIAAWVAINEPNRADGDYYMNVRPGPALCELAARVTPDISVIRGSGLLDFEHSGDSHNYAGSLAGGDSEYTDGAYRDTEKLNTEFGVDAPPCRQSLLNTPELEKKLALGDARIAELQTYQYRLIKYISEQYRLLKRARLWGCVQFLFSDPLPQSYFGALDFYGVPKLGYEALCQSYAPIMPILEHKREARAVWIVNDLLEDARGTLIAIATDSNGRVRAREQATVEARANGVARAFEFTNVKPGDTVTLIYSYHNGEKSVTNRYIDPLNHPAHPSGHPFCMDSEYGMPLYSERSVAPDVADWIRV